MFLKPIKYRYWKDKCRGKKFKDYDRGVGYYITVGVLGMDEIGSIWKPKMTSGETGIYELIKYETFSDPSDMIKHGWYNMIGYVGKKPIHECTYKEFVEIYSK